MNKKSIINSEAKLMKNICNFNVWHNILTSIDYGNHMLTDVLVTVEKYYQGSEDILLDRPCFIYGRLS